MNEYRGIIKAFCKYCYKYAEDLDWDKFRNPQKQLYYYRTRVNQLRVIVGFNLSTQRYFMTIEKLGEAQTQPHVWFFPSRVQRLFNLLKQLEGKRNHE